jgi:hypothetical protein
MSRRQAPEEFNWSVDLLEFGYEEIQDSDRLGGLSENIDQHTLDLGKISFTIALQIHPIHSFLQLPRLPCIPRIPPR